MLTWFRFVLIINQLKITTMLSEFEPKEYLSKRENGTYCIIKNGMPINNYTSKPNCIRVAEIYQIQLPNVVWSAKDGAFIEE